jgi:hypothetical protein
MKWRILIAGLCTGLMTSAAHAAAPSGDYVEARTASVFAGACHYNSELMTSGRDAIMAWNIASGSYNGVNLAGVKVMAVVSCEDNLAEDSAARRSEIVVDDRASDAQAKAVVQAMKDHYSKSLGQIVSVQREPVTFKHVGKQYAVEAYDFATISMQAMPNDECCKQPNLVWYSPLVTLTGRKVGYVQNAAYTAGTLGDRWQREDENSAFYGAFSF